MLGQTAQRGIGRAIARSNHTAPAMTVTRQTQPNSRYKFLAALHGKAYTRSSSRGAGPARRWPTRVFCFMRSSRVEPASKRSLTEKQKRFVAAYIGTLDPLAAARAAGYSERHAKAVAERYLGQRRFVEAIARYGSEATRSGGLKAGKPITKGWITDELTELYRAVKACLPTKGRDDGKAPSAASLQSAVKMLELLIKHLEDDGLKGRKHPEGSEPDLSRLDRDELRQLEAILARTVPETGSTDAREA